MTVSNYSTTAANNTTINSISIAEGMPPSNVNNAMRNQLSDCLLYTSPSPRDQRGWRMPG